MGHIKIINLKIEDYDKLLSKLAVTRQRGKHCFVHPYKKGKLLKIFHSRPQTDFNNPDIQWGDVQKNQPRMNVSLIEATKIQNICWMYGLAPRVYGLVGVKIDDRKFIAQIVEDSGTKLMKEHADAEETYDAVIDLGVTYGWEKGKRDVSKWDVIQTDQGKKLVDFNTFHFAPNHLDKVKELWVEFARYGKKYYQDVYEWGLVGGPRKPNQRVEWMKLDEIDFKGKTVLDIGCSGTAFFARYARDKKAKAMGVDSENKGSPDPIMAAQLLCNELEQWDIDFYESDLETWNYEKGLYLSADITFFLSLNFHIGIPEWLPKVTKELCIFEDNSKNKDAEETLKRMFKKVEFVGLAHDQGDCQKKLYHCFK